MRFYATFPETLPNGQPSPSGHGAPDGRGGGLHPGRGRANTTAGGNLKNTTPATFDGPLPPNLR